MKKIFVFTCCLLIPFFSLYAQAVYELSFTFPKSQGFIEYKGFFNDFNGGKGKLRLKFVPPAANDTILVDMDVMEDDAEVNEGCVNNGRLYYKLLNVKYKAGRDPGVVLPKYICYQKNAATGFFEPSGVANSSADCKADIVKFSSIAIIKQANLKELVAAYFKPDDLFYRNVFVNNKVKALSVWEHDVKLYLLFVANVTDPKIGTADRKNMKDAIAFFGKVKQSLGINQFIYDTITGANFTKQNVENKIRTFLTPGPNDIVVFYYSGHGFRTANDSRPGPYIGLVSNDKQDYKTNSIKLDDITETIRNKHGRLNLVISDCCNKDPGQTGSVNVGANTGGKGGLGDYWSDTNLRALFLNPTPTTIMFTAAEQYQIALSNPEFGGYFSNFFITAMDNHLSYNKTNVTWADIIKQTIDNTWRKANRTWCNEAKTVKCNMQVPVSEPRF